MVQIMYGTEGCDEIMVSPLSFNHNPSLNTQQYFRIMTIKIAAKNQLFNDLIFVCFVFAMFRLKIEEHQSFTMDQEYNTPHMHACTHTHTHMQ